MLQDLVPAKPLSLLNNKTSQTVLSFFQFWQQSRNMIFIIFIGEWKYLTCRILYFRKRMLFFYSPLDCPNTIKYISNSCSAFGVANSISRFKGIQINLFYHVIVLRSVCCGGSVTYRFGRNTDARKNRTQHHQSIDIVVYDLKAHLARLQCGASCLSCCIPQTSSYHCCGYSIYYNNYPTAYQSFLRFPNLWRSIVKVASHNNNAERPDKCPHKTSCCTQTQISFSHYHTYSKNTERTPSSFSDQGPILSFYFCERSA
ncbi:hypothetical protein PsAD46_03337 [Pseudovibrio sp. Ad46]|nr:hypothetical protein PsAD46_03337 [Pseudovibrio sp. Ad46]